MTGPITPEQAFDGKHIPDEVFEAFNELIREGHGIVKQGAAITRILAKMPSATRGDLFDKGWLNVEDAYRSVGWQVVYDKPAYDESYEAFFEFRRPSR